MKKTILIILFSLFTTLSFTSEEIKPRKTPLKKLSKQLGNGELIKIKSYQTSNYKGIMEGWYKESPIVIDALITYPKGKGPFPLLLITHSSGSLISLDTPDLGPQAKHPWGRPGRELDPQKTLQRHWKVNVSRPGVCSSVPGAFWNRQRPKTFKST